MILLSYSIKRYEFIRSLLQDLRNVLIFGNEQAIAEPEERILNIGEEVKDSLVNIQIYLKLFKEMTMTSLNNFKPEAKDVLDEIEDKIEFDDPFMRNFKESEKEEEAKRKLAEEERK
jgi:hypothetical protein